MVVAKRGGGLDGEAYYTAHAVLALPLKQFILNAFEKAPSRDRTRETPTAKRGTQREGEGEKKNKTATVKAHGHVRGS